jgi:hypothetical protein
LDDDADLGADDHAIGVDVLLEGLIVERPTPFAARRKRFAANERS